MPVSQSILNFVIILAVILTVGNFFRESHDRRIVFLFTGVITVNILSLGIVVLHNYGIVVRDPLARTMLTTFPFFIGPLYYFYFSAVFGHHDEWTWRRCIHFIPAAAAFACILAVSMRMGIPGGDGLALARKLVFLSQALHILAYYLASALMMNAYRKDSKDAAAGMALTGAYALTFLVAAPGIFFAAGPAVFDLLTAAFAYNGLVFIAHYLVAQKFPVLFAIYAPAPGPQHGEGDRTGMLSEEDAGRIMRDLNRRLEEEKIYLVEDLTLNALAHELGLTPHRLSYFLNNHVRMNFYSLVNSYRVREAQAMLDSEPVKSIIRIAFDSGFSSKTSFNRAFQKITGMTPTDYRDRARGASGARPAGED